MFRYIIPSGVVILLSFILPTFFPALSPLLLWRSPASKAILDVSLQHEYTATTLSTDPQLIYIDNFFSPSEIAYLIELGSPLYTPSRVFGSESLAHKHRVSSTCLLPPDPVVKVVNTRILAFLSSLSLPNAGLETLQLVKYGPGEYFDAHYDWFDSLEREKGWNGRLYNRLASIFFYLEANCTGGDTWFPEITGVRKDGLEEGVFADVEKGVAFRPKVGSGVFWVNLLENGLGDGRTIHAGLPLKDGSKVGMNVWIKRSFGR